MTKKENYLAVCRGQRTGWIPAYEEVCQFIFPQVMKDPTMKLYEKAMEYREKGIKELPEETDCFGVVWVMDDFGSIVKPGFTLFDDIEDWKEYFHIPDLTGFDWDTACKEDAAYLNPEMATQLFCNSVFTVLTNAMGFMEALMTLAAEDDALLEFFDAITTFHETVITNVLTRVQCDSFCVVEDFANESNMFLSPDAYRRLLKPYHKRLIDAAKKANPDIIIEQHTCGKCEAVIDDMVEMGVQVWQPAQPTNDLDAIQRKYGNRLVFNGVWNNTYYCAVADVTEEEIKKSVREVINHYAQDGGYIFWNGGALSTDEKILTRLKWSHEEALRYGADFKGKC